MFCLRLQLERLYKSAHDKKKKEKKNSGTPSEPSERPWILTLTPRLRSFNYTG